MRRKLYQELLKWKEERERKPLLLQGARQVGKTYLVNQFAKNEYKDYVYLNFEEDLGLQTLFDESLQPEKLIENISFYFNRRIVPQETLLFFDEIQIAPRALTSLKYFCEEAPEYHLIAASSLLGVSVGKKSSFPVGKVEFMTMYPMNFMEYLHAAGGTLLAEYLKEKESLEPLSEVIHNKLMYHLKIYLLDSGLLGAMLELSPQLITTPTQLFSEYNGAFIENFVASELITTGKEKLYYWTSNNSAEVDFIFQKDDKILPLEVKSGLNRNKKSLRRYAEKYHPEYIYRVSPRNFTKDNDFINLPLYATFKL